MKVEGTSEVEGTPEEVFDRLLDPELLSRCIPGCERLEESSPGVYEAVVRAGVGPIKGRFEGEATLQDVVRGKGYRLVVEGKSTVGHVHGEAKLRLERTESGTRIHYSGEATFSGRIASVGSRLLGGAAKKQARQFFDQLAVEVSA